VAEEGTESALPTTVRLLLQEVLGLHEGIETDSDDEQDPLVNVLRLCSLCTIDPTHGEVVLSQVEGESDD
jgi:hypothetical protein